MTDDPVQTLADCPSHFRMDRLASGELDDSERAQLLGHVAKCDACRGREARRREAEASHTVDLTLLRRLEATAARAPERSPLSVSPARRRLVWGAAGASAAAAALLLMAPPSPTDRERSVAAATRSKGAARSALYVADGARVRAWDSSLALHPGDSLQVTVSSPERAYAAVVSVDGAGHRSVYVPVPADAVRVGMVALPEGNDVPLPQSTVVDDVLGTETVAVVLCREQVADVRTLLPIADAGEPPAGCVVDRYTLDKRPRP